MAAVVVFIAVRQPWLGLALSYDGSAGGAAILRSEGPAAAIPDGTTLMAIAGRMDRLHFVPDDFTIEPASSIGTYENHGIFLARQERLSHILAAPEVLLDDAQGRTWTVSPRPSRPFTSLPADFWVQLFVGLFAWLIAAGIWAFRTGETSARYLLLSGFSTLMFAPLAAIYSTRELALPATLFRTINDLNFLGGSLFAASLLSLLLYYPRRLAPLWVGKAIVGVFVAWFVAQEVGVFELMTLARRLLVMIAVASTFFAAGMQWRITRADPIARAALQWFLLSWLVGVAVFAVFILLPQMFGIDTSAFQGYGFLLFLLVYGGLAFGILRFRLFDLGEWWVRVLGWIVTILVLVSLDLVFLLVLDLSTSASLALSLLACGLLWLPLRGWLWN